MKSCLIVAEGWIGDTLFCLSLPEKLKKELNYDVVDLFSYRPQPLNIVRQNKFIDEIFFNTFYEKPKKEYDDIFRMPIDVDLDTAPTIHFQKSCGLKNTSTEFNLSTDPNADNLANFFINCLPKNKIKIAYQGDWDVKKWNYTKEEYERGETNRKGDMRKVISILEQQPKYSLIEISPYQQINHQLDVRGYDTDPNRYSLIASMIKGCDFFLGAEGGMVNLAAGVGTKCIMTTCQMHKHFGYNGERQKKQNPQLGPDVFFPNKGHIHLDPYLSEEKIAEKIIEIIG